MPDIKPNLVTEGDVIKADASFCIAGLSDDHKILTISQNFRNKAHRTKADPYPEPQYVPTLRGPKTGNVQYGLNGPTLAQIVAEEGIKIRGKKFLVTRTDMEGGGYDPQDRSGIPFPNGHHVIARELTPKNEIKPGGLMLEFYQTGSFCYMVQQPKIVGRMEPTFSAFKPVS